MKSFVFKSAIFELSLEGYENPIEIFNDVAKKMQQSPNSLETKIAADRQGALETEQETSKAVDIDEFFSETKPTKLRPVLEGVIEFITINKGQLEFTKEEVFDLAKTSLYYENNWTKNRTSTFERLVKEGYIAKRPEGKFVLKRALQKN